MKGKYTIVERYTYETAACDCCTGTWIDHYEIFAGDELVDGGFLDKSDALVAILNLHGIEVEFE